MAEEKEIANIPQPSSVNVPLFLHQLKSVEHMESLESTKEIVLHPSLYITTRVGVLADLPGYGKSLSMLGLIGKTQENQIPESFAFEKTKQYSFVSQTKVTMLQQVNCSLILVNISLLSQWIAELSRTNLRYLAVYNRTEIEDINLSLYDVVIVANNIYNLFSQVYRKKCWKRFVIDEPASLKLHAMEESYAQFYWLITGTPNELYLKRRTGFINDLLPEDDNMFHYIILKNDDDFVKNSYQMPLTKHLYYQTKGNISSLFEGIVADNIIEMIDAGNMTGVFNALCSDEQHDPTIFGEYRMRKEKRLQDLQKDSDTNGKTQEKMQTIEGHLKLLNEKIFRYVRQNNCLICNKAHVQPHVLSCCQHIFCGYCVANECPLCKSNDSLPIPFDLKEFKELRESCSYSHLTESKTKIDTILSIIGDAENKKILIFSNYNDSFTILKKFLDERKLVYLELRGTKEKRDNTIDSYKTGSVNILLLNTIHSGAGLNLQETSDIILYHKIHEYQKIQVIGRANRIGRKIQLNVHYIE